MRILSIIHHDDAGAGVFGEVPGIELVEWMASADGSAPALDEFGAVMVFGGSMQVDQEQSHPWLRAEKALLREVLERSTPLLGVCLGFQLLAEVAGGAARRAAAPEIGWRRVDVTGEGPDDPLMGPLAPSFEVFQWHSYEAPLPPGAVELARNDACLQSFRLEGKPAWGVQFHAEVTGPDLGSWLDAWAEDEDALRSGIDPQALRAESEQRIGAQNEFGRELAARFVAEARAVAAAQV
jgi:GMP synthase-like glutamine amidotransferase